MSLLMETEGLSVRPSLDGCIKCTICESACPYAAVTERFPGPKTVGPQEERFRQGPLSADWSVDYCSGCGICSRVCPQDVRIAEINSRARAQLKEQRGIPLRDQLLARPDWMGRLGRPIRPLFNWAMGTPWCASRWNASSASTARPRSRRWPPRTFQQWARRHPEPPGARPSGLLPRLQHQLLRAPPGPDGGGRARAPGAGGGDPPAGLLRAAAPVQRELPGRPHLHHPAGPPAAPLPWGRSRSSPPRPAAG